MSVTVTDKFIDAGGIKFQYREAGDSEKIIVFLHGAGGQSPKASRFPAMLGEKHRVLIPSRPGFDQTPVGDCKTIKDVVEAVAKFIAAAAPGRKVHLVAQSAGGAIGAWLAILHPELVASLVLSAPAAFAIRHAPPPGSAPPNLADMAKRLYGEDPASDRPRPRKSASRPVRTRKRIWAVSPRPRAIAISKNASARSTYRCCCWWPRRIRWFPKARCGHSRTHPELHAHHRLRRGA